MLGYKENFSTAGENSDHVGVLICLSSNPHDFLRSEKPVEAFDFGVFVDKDNLPSVLNHTVTSIAEKGKDSLMRIVFEEMVQLFHHIVAVFDLGFNQL